MGYKYGNIEDEWVSRFSVTCVGHVLVQVATQLWNIFHIL